MTLNFKAQASLELALSNLSPAIRGDIVSRFNLSRFESIPGGRVLLLDWTGAYSDTAATVSVASTGIATLTGTAVSPVIRVPSDDTVSAPATAMKPLALEVALISQPAIAGQNRDPECLITLNKTGPQVLASGTLAAGSAEEVSHFHWSSDQTAAWHSLVFSGIRQHGCRLVALLLGAP